MDIILGQKLLLEKLKKDIVIEPMFVYVHKNYDKAYYTLKAHDNIVKERYIAKGVRPHSYIYNKHTHIARACKVNGFKFNKLLKELGFKYNISVGYYMDTREELLSKIDDIYNYILMNGASRK